jgi:hypothetical protein
MYPRAHHYDKLADALVVARILVVHDAEQGAILQLAHDALLRAGSAHGTSPPGRRTFIAFAGM